MDDLLDSDGGGEHGYLHATLAAGLCDSHTTLQSDSTFGTDFPCATSSGDLGHADTLIPQPRDSSPLNMPPYLHEELCSSENSPVGAGHPVNMMTDSSSAQPASSAQAAWGMQGRPNLSAPGSRAQGDDLLAPMPGALPVLPTPGVFHHPVDQEGEAYAMQHDGSLAGEAAPFMHPAAGARGPLEIHCVNCQSVKASPSSPHCLMHCINSSCSQNPETAVSAVPAPHMCQTAEDVISTRARKRVGYYVTGPQPNHRLCRSRPLEVCFRIRWRSAEVDLLQASEAAGSGPIPGSFWLVLHSEHPDRPPVSHPLTLLPSSSFPSEAHLQPDDWILQASIARDWLQPARGQKDLEKYCLKVMWFRDGVSTEVHVGCPFLIQAASTFAEVYHKKSRVLKAAALGSPPVEPLVPLPADPNRSHKRPPPDDRDSDGSSSSAPPLCAPLDPPALVKDNLLRAAIEGSTPETINGLDVDSFLHHLKWLLENGAAAVMAQTTKPSTTVFSCAPEDARFHPDLFVDALDFILCLHFLYHESFERIYTHVSKLCGKKGLKGFPHIARLLNLVQTHLHAASHPQLQRTAGLVITSLNHASSAAGSPWVRAATESTAAARAAQPAAAASSVSSSSPSVLHPTQIVVLSGGLTASNAGALLSVLPRDFLETAARLASEAATEEDLLLSFQNLKFGGATLVPLLCAKDSTETTKQQGTSNKKTQLKGYAASAAASSITVAPELAGWPWRPCLCADSASCHCIRNHYQTHWLPFRDALLQRPRKAL